MLRRRASFFLALSALTLGAQGVFLNVDKPGEPICPRVMVDKTSLEFKSQYGRNKANLANLRYYQASDQFIPMGERKDVSAFAAYDDHSKGTAISSLKGKVVLVGLWSKNCEPSASMIMELAGIYEKRAQFGFELIAVNFDENQLVDPVRLRSENQIDGGWRAINKFKMDNRVFFERSKMPLYVPGIGKEGPANFMDMVYSLPVLFVVDRQGRLAELHIGYKNGFVGEALKRALRERAEPAAPAAPPATSANPPKATP
jgi:thiol-disulfide isomerase/thioredoxin